MNFFFRCQVILAEEDPFFPASSSILSDSKLRHELGIETDTTTCGVVSGAQGPQPYCHSRMILYRCLFCAFVGVGNEGETVCINHMKLFHNFDFSQVRLKVASDCREKLVNYIRYMVLLYYIEIFSFFKINYIVLSINYCVILTIASAFVILSFILFYI